MQHVSHLAPFLAMLALEEGASIHTITAYRSDITGFLAHADASGIQDQVGAYVRLLTYQGYAGSSIQRKVAAIKRFFRYLYLQGIVAEGVTQVVLPPVVRTLPVGLSEDDTQKILAQPGDTDRYALRDKALLLLLYASGMRVSELCSLQINGYFCDASGVGYVRIMGKGKRERVVPISNSVGQVVLDYIQRNRGGLRDGHMFVSRSGKPLSRQAAFQIVKKYAKRMGLPNAYPHQMRHAFATHLLNRDVGVRDVQSCLGHAKLSTTQRYLSVSTTHLQRVYRAAHPLNREVFSDQKAESC